MSHDVGISPHRGTIRTLVLSQHCFLYKREALAAKYFMKAGRDMRPLLSVLLFGGICLQGGAATGERDPYTYSCARVPTGPIPPNNQLILRIVAQMPDGQGFGRGDGRIDALASAIEVLPDQIRVSPMKAVPTFCTAATYLVLWTALAELNNTGKLKLDKEALEGLQVRSKQQMPDGTGVWGRWNADGPGVAVVFKELHLGTNRTDIREALPGDFLKISWNQSVGRGERGHLGIFDSERDCLPTAHETRPQRHICFWSSQSENDLAIPDDKKGTAGFGLKCVPQKKVVRAIYSRLESFAAFNAAPQVMGPKSPRYSQSELATWLDRVRTQEEVEKLTR